MAVQRMDNVAIVVEDLDAAIDFYVELGLELEDRQSIRGLYADQATGLDDVRSEIAMMRVPDGHGRLELTRYEHPAAVPAPAPASNTLGMHRVMFAVDDLPGTLDRLRPHGAELIGEVARYDDVFLLCYLRGPGGIIVALAEQIG